MQMTCVGVTSKTKLICSHGCGLVVDYYMRLLSDRGNIHECSYNSRNQYFV